MKKRSIIIFILSLLIAVFGLLAGRLFYLQTGRGSSLYKNTARQRRSIVTQRPQRGIIVDSKGRILAASNRVEAVFAQPEAIKDVKDVASSLQKILDFPAHEICGIIYESKNPGYVRIKTPITPTQRDEIEKARLFGIGIQSDWQRFYPMGKLVSNPIGFSGVDQTGLAGIELRYDKLLIGTAGKDTYMVDALRKPIAMAGKGDVVRDGFGLVLTIDATIQQFARAALLSQYKKYEAESAVAIVMEPFSGAILAMVSLPDFDPDRFGSAGSDTLRNRAITDPFEPGSVFKPIVAALAIDSGDIDRNEKIFCEKGYYTKYRIGEWAGHKFEDLSIEQILVQSSNIGMAKIGLKMKREKLYEGLKLFGFGKRTGIDLPGEDSGLIYPPSKWSGYTPTRIPYGHEIMVTTVQIVRAYCILANDGRPVTPHLLGAVVDSDGRIEQLNRSEPLPGYIIKPDVAKWIVQHALVKVVTEGTGKEAALDEWQVFGKTGTANIALGDQKGYDEQNYTASFVGGAPAENPRIVVLVSIRKPNKALRKGYSGGRVAAPVVGDIIKKTLTYLGQN